MKENETIKQGKTTVDPFEDYISSNVKRAQILYTFEETINKLKQMKATYEETVEKIVDMDKENPDFKEKYMEKYISAREEVGLKYTEEEKEFFYEIFRNGFKRRLGSFDQNLKQRLLVLRG